MQVQRRNGVMSLRFRVKEFTEMDIGEKNSSERDEIEVNTMD